MYSEALVPFDLYRIFLGNYQVLFFLEVIFRTTIMYLYAICAVRLMGKRGLGQLTPFEFIIVIVLGSAAGDPMFYPNVPIFHGMAVITTVVLLERVVSFLSTSNDRVHDFLESEPRIVVKHGRINHKALSDEQLTTEDLLMELRMQGIQSLDEVEYAFFEPSGKLSVFRYERHNKHYDRSTFPPELVDDSKKEKIS